LNSFSSTFYSILQAFEKSGQNDFTPGEITRIKFLNIKYLNTKGEMTGEMITDDFSLTSSVVISLIPPELGVV